jgi:AraC-like DNA-binding protein
VLEAIAREFHMSPTTLRRRLEAEFTSYQDIKDEVLRDVAVHYLYSTGLNVVAIGALPGFQESTAFRRASKKWSRVQLGEYRRRQAIAGSAQRTAVAPR